MVFEFGHGDAVVAAHDMTFLQTADDALADAACGSSNEYAHSVFLPGKLRFVQYYERGFRRAAKAERQPVAHAAARIELALPLLVMSPNIAIG